MPAWRVPVPLPMKAGGDLKIGYQALLHGKEYKFEKNVQNDNGFEPTIHFSSQLVFYSKICS